MIPQFARYVLEQVEKNDPDEAPHWNEVTRKDPTMIEDICDHELTGLPQPNPQRQRQLRIKLQPEQQQQESTSCQRVSRIGDFPENREPSVGAYTLRANALSEYRAKSREDSKGLEGQHSPSRGVQHPTTGLSDEEDKEEEAEDEEEGLDEEDMALGLSEKKPVSDHQAQELTQFKNKFDVLHEKLAERNRREWLENWFDSVLGPLE